MNKIKIFKPIHEKTVKNLYMTRKKQLIAFVWFFLAFDYESIVVFDIIEIIKYIKFYIMIFTYYIISTFPCHYVYSSR